MSRSSADVRITVAYDDDASAAAEALLAVLRRPIDHDSEEDAEADKEAA
ncbi:MAG: hypothetical protein M3Q50_12925 [Chloroflexota bacterium]|nr:hypothetical protein [Chloroflexota bacterium]